MLLSHRLLGNLDIILNIKIAARELGFEQSGSRHSVYNIISSGYAYYA